MGSYYLTGLLEEYAGSYPFALAAYNAGPKRVKYWKKINGNPQKGKIDYVNWIELIKFKETRNYVQRVLENVNVYRYMLSRKPVRIFNFFEDTMKIDSHKSVIIWFFRPIDEPGFAFNCF